MAQVPEAVRMNLETYLARIKQIIPVEKAILFGSYATGAFDSGSDVDLAIFSDYFQGMKRVESIAFLLTYAVDFDLDLDLEPLAFTMDEYEERAGIVDEILKTGIEM